MLPTSHYSPESTEEFQSAWPRNNYESRTHLLHEIKLCFHNFMWNRNSVQKAHYRYSGVLWQLVRFLYSCSSRQRLRSIFTNQRGLNLWHACLYACFLRRIHKQIPYPLCIVNRSLIDRIFYYALEIFTKQYTKDLVFTSNDFKSVISCYHFLGFFSLDSMYRITVYPKESRRNYQTYPNLYFDFSYAE